MEQASENASLASCWVNILENESLTREFVRVKSIAW